MGLIRTSKHSIADLRKWAECSALDMLYSPRALERLRINATMVIEEFLAQGPAYVGFSGGKDSVCVAGLVGLMGIRVPMVHIVVQPIRNPEVPLVRDALLKRFPSLDYHEIEVWCSRDEKGWHASGTLEAGFRAAAAKFGDAWISGVRGQESSDRAKRVARGLTFGRSLVPIGHWTGRDVFAFLAHHDLPIHPAYGYSLGGLLDRERIRVSSIGGRRGSGMGRSEWEWTYYPEAMHLLEQAESPCPDQH